MLIKYVIWLGLGDTLLGREDYGVGEGFSAEALGQHHFIHIESAFTPRMR